MEVIDEEQELPTVLKGLSAPPITLTEEQELYRDQIMPAPPKILTEEQELYREIIEEDTEKTAVKTRQNTSLLNWRLKQKVQAQK